jgi:hypothetical protein
MLLMTNVLLLASAAVLTITLFEIIEERKRKAFIINRMFEELNACETIAQNMVSNYER